ncbi:MAG: S9 family peptidase [Candidatus Zixiibacteriota bacterium]
MKKSAWLLLTVAALVSATNAHAQMSDSAYIPDIDAFMQIGANYSPQVSDDGTVRCFASGMSGVQQLYRLDANGWPSQLTVFTEGIDFYNLSHNGRMAIVGAAVGGSEQTNLYLVDTRTGRVTTLTDLEDCQIADPLWSWDDARFYYRSNQVNKKDFHVYEITIATGESRPVYVAEGYNGPAVISKDNKWLVTYYYPSNVDNDLFLVNIATGEGEKITPHEGNAQFAPAGFSLDGTMLYIVSNANPDGIMRRATLDLKSKKVDFIDTKGVWEVEEFALSDDRTKMAWIINEEGYARLHLRDIPSNSDLPVPPLDGIIGSVSFDGPDAIMFSFDGPTKTPDCWRWNYRTKELKQLTFAVTAGIDPSIFVEPELIRFKSFDDLEITAFMYLPPGAKEGDKVPFIVSAHGGPESQFRPNFIRNFQYFALNGFGVLAVNPRGSSGYGQEFLDMDNYKDRWKSVKDYEMATRWIIEQGYADAARVGITGGSYGGYMTLAALTANPDLYAAGIDIVGIANFVTFLKQTADYRRALRESEYGPLSDSTYLWEISPLANVDKIKAPLFVIHGENDPRVPVGEARQIAAAVAARGGVVDTLIFPDEGHGASKRVNILVQYRRMVDFFNRHLKDEQPMREPSEGG